MKKYILGVFVLLTLFMPGFSRAQEEIVPVLVDVFKMAGEVQVPPSGARDFIALGGVVDTTYPVSQDVLAAGGTILITAPVAGDVRAVGSQVIIDAPVAGNVAVWGSEVHVTERGSIAGSAVIGAEHVTIDAPIEGSVRLFADVLDLNSSFGADAEMVVSRMRTGTGFSIAGDVEYTSSDEPLFPDGTVMGSVSFIPRTIPSGTNPLTTIARLISLFGMLVIGLVCATFIPRTMRTLVERTMRAPIADFGWGAGLLILTPIVLGILALTLIGIPLALIGLCVYFIALYFSKIIVGFVLGTYIIGAIKGRTYVHGASLILVMVVGISVFWLVSSIPFIGFVISLLGMIWGLGIIVRLKMAVLKKLEG